MTINMGNADDGPAAGRVGEEVTLKVVGVASNERVMAAKVETDVPSKNETKHVTLAVNRMVGAKPVESNKLSDWKEVEEITLRGTIAEV
jgi:hypothetical protein